MNLKEQLFCYYFVKLQNHKEAAIKAGYNIEKADFIGIKLLYKKHIKKQIESIVFEDRQNDLLQKSIAGFERLAFGSVSDSIKLINLISDEIKDDTDNIPNFSELDLFNISEIKKSKGGCVEIKFFDRFKALEKIYEISKLISNTSQTSDLISAIKQSAEAISNSNFELENELLELKEKNDEIYQVDEDETYE